MDHGKKVTIREVRSALDEIKDPCSCVTGAPAGLHEMGLVHDIAISAVSGGTKVSLRISATEPTCPFGVMFTKEAERRLLALPGVVETAVTFDPFKDWTELDASPEWRARIDAVRRERGLDPVLLGGGQGKGEGIGRTVRMEVTAPTRKLTWVDQAR